jgi:predicted nucleic acid-binding protein
MQILVDTNVLLRAAQRRALGQVAAGSIKALHRQNHSLCLTPQNIVEFWNVCTRPLDVNGLGLSTAGAERHVLRLRRMFTILPDSLRTFEKWFELVVQHGVVGSKVHDARLVAAMKVHGIDSILTFNVRDFTRYDGITVIDPHTIA